MPISTGVRHDRRRVYRLIDRDLYSAPTNKPLKDQEYTLEKPGVVEADSREDNWRVVVKGGEVWLEK